MVCILQEEDFGQKVDLCIRLREILNGYEETSVVKELLQVILLLSTNGRTATFLLRVVSPKIARLTDSYFSFFTLVCFTKNADDAGSDVFKLCFDQRTHPSEAMAYPSLKAFQGPALLCYNSGVFSEKDLISVLITCLRVRLTEDVQKVFLVFTATAGCFPTLLPCN